MLSSWCKTDAIDGSVDKESIYLFDPTGSTDPNYIRSTGTAGVIKLVTNPSGAASVKYCSWRTDSRCEEVTIAEEEEPVEAVAPEPGMAGDPHVQVSKSAGRWG